MVFRGLYTETRLGPETFHLFGGFTKIQTPIGYEASLSPELSEPGPSEVRQGLRSEIEKK